MSSACGQARRRPNWCQGHNHKERVANIHFLISIDAQPKLPSLIKTLKAANGFCYSKHFWKISQVIAVMLITSQIYVFLRNIDTIYQTFRKYALVKLKHLNILIIT